MNAYAASVAQDIHDNTAPPVRAQQLSAHLDRLGERDRAFALSLLGQLNDRGLLSRRQWYWVEQLAVRATETVAPAPLAEVGDLAGVYQLFAQAQAHLKRPAIVLQMAGNGAGELRLTVAGERAKAPGSINVASPGRFGENIWYGRVHQDGKFETARKLQGDPRMASITALLTAFAADPAKVAAEHGKLTGRCCFCNLPLKDARSTAVGYGKICARHYGLPWGA